MGRIGGIVSFRVDGEIYNIAGDVTYGLGKPEKKKKIGNNRVVGHTEKPTIPFIDFSGIKDDNFDFDKVANIDGSSATLELSDGTVIQYTGIIHTNPDGLGGSTAEGEVKLRFEADSAEVIK